MSARWETCAEEGGALPAVVALIVTLMVLVGGVLLYEGLQYRLYLREGLRLQARYQAERCVALAQQRLAEGETLPFAVGASIGAGSAESGGLAPRSVTGRVVAHGLLAVAQCVGAASRERVELRALIGNAPTPDYDYALVLGRSTSGVSVADTTRISGGVRVGLGGVRPGQLARRPFRGRVTGDIDAEADAALPAIAPDAVGTLIEQHLKDTANMATQDGWQRPSDADGTVQSTPLPTRYEAGNFTLAGPATLPAFSRLVVEGALRVTGDVRFDDAVLVAGGDITLAADSEGRAPSGSVQILAGGDLDVRGPARLAYPSALATAEQPADYAVTGPYNARRERSLALSGDILMVGVVLGGFGSALRLGPQSRVRGAVYAGGSVEARGRVEGTLLTEKLTASEGGTYYEGWLIGAQLLREERPDPFALPLALGDAARPVVIRAEWVDARTISPASRRQP